MALKIIKKCVTCSTSFTKSLNGTDCVDEIANCLKSSFYSKSNLASALTLHPWFEPIVDTTLVDINYVQICLDCDKKYTLSDDWTFCIPGLMCNDPDCELCDEKGICIEC
jgi:hypothetical protein